MNIWMPVASGTRLDELAAYGSAVPEGSFGKLIIDFRAEAPASAIQTLVNKLDSEDMSVSASGSRVVVEWKQGFAWLPVIVAAFFSIIALAILIVGWQLSRSLPKLAINAAVIIGGIIILIVLFFLLFRSKGFKKKFG